MIQLKPLTKTQVFGFLGVYYALQAGLRIAMGGACQLDEAEQILLSQDWRWGYGSQGPLYTWIFKALLPWVGSDLATLALMKNALLFSIHACVYRTASELMQDEGRALAATASILLLPHLVYESQRDQTHLVLATFLAVATLALFFQVIRKPNRVRFFLFGLSAGLGLLSKYNFIVFLAGLLLSALIFRDTRKVLLNAQALWSLLPFLAVLAPHFLWMIEHPELLFSQSHKFGNQSATSDGASRVQGVLRFSQRVVEYLVVPAVIAVVIGSRFLRRPIAPPKDIPCTRKKFAQSALGTLVISLVLTVTAVAFFGITQFKGRWLQPVMVLLPVLTLYFARRSLRPVVQHRLFRATILAGTVAMVGVHGTVWAAQFLDRPHNINVRFDLLAQELQAEGFDGGTILSDDRRVAGNLLRQFEGSIALVPTIDYFRPNPDRSTILVWDASKGYQPPPALRLFATAWIDEWPCHQPTGIAEKPAHRGDPGVGRFCYLLIPAGGSN